MNTDTNPSISDLPTNPEAVVRPTVRRSKPRFRIVAFVVAALMLATGLGAASAAPASAATTPAYGTVSVCFQAPTGLGGYGTYNYGVNIDTWFNGAWAATGTVVYPGTNGCLTTPLPAGYYWRFRVYQFVRGAGTYTGVSNWVLPSAGGRYTLPTVYLVRS